MIRFDKKNKLGFYEFFDRSKVTFLQATFVLDIVPFILTQQVCGSEVSLDPSKFLFFTLALLHERLDKMVCTKKYKTISNITFIQPISLPKLFF